MDLLRRRDVLGQDTVHGHLVVVVRLARQQEESTRDTRGEYFAISPDIYRGKVSLFSGFT